MQRVTGSVTEPECPVARWQSGYAAACKAVDAGSIPTLASILFRILSASSPGGGIGRRYGLKIRCPKGRAGSSPAPGTNESLALIIVARRRTSRQGSLTLTNWA